MFMRMKYLGVALFALSALASAGAGAASAEVVHDFEAESPSIITGLQSSETEHIEYEFGKGWVLKCGADEANGTVTTFPTSSLTLQFTHSECLLNTLAAVVDTQGCKYVFSGKTNEEHHGSVELECEPTKVMRVTVSGCTIEIEKQKFFKKGASYVKTESNGIKDIDVKVTTELGTYKKLGFLCETIGGNGGDLSVRGTYTLKAYKDSGGVEGAQTNLTWKETTLK